MSLDEIKLTISSLSENEKRNLLSHLKNLIQNDPDISGVRTEIVEKRFSANVVCPTCGSEKIVKNGHYYYQQRYLCRDCKRHFGEMSESNLHSTKKTLREWLKYAEYMVEGWSLRRIAKEMHISKTTAFMWRHKILIHIKEYLFSSQVSGIVEADETFVLESYKGNHSNDGFTMPRPPRKHGAKAGMRGVSSEQICIVCGIDRKDNILSDMVCRGRVDTKRLEKFFAKRIYSGSTLCTDAHPSYRQLETRLGVKVKQLPEGKNKDGIYHIQHVNSYHSRF